MQKAIRKELNVVASNQWFPQPDGTRVRHSSYPLSWRALNATTGEERMGAQAALLEEAVRCCEHDGPDDHPGGGRCVYAGCPCPRGEDGADTSMDGAVATSLAEKPIDTALGHAIARLNEEALPLIMRSSRSRKADLDSNRMIMVRSRLEGLRAAAPDRILAGLPLKPAVLVESFERTFGWEEFEGATVEDWTAYLEALRPALQAALTRLEEETDSVMTAVVVKVAIAVTGVQNTLRGLMPGAKGGEEPA